MKKHLIFILYLSLLVLLVSSCKNKNVLDYTINNLEDSWTTHEINEFKSLKKNKDNIIGYVYKNNKEYTSENWINIKKNKELVNYFKKKGINKKNDITKTIYLSFYMKLHSETFDVNKYIQQIIDNENYIKKREECIKEGIKKGLDVRKLYNEGDTIIVKMPVDTVSYRVGKGNAFLYNCPKLEWKFNKGKDLVVKSRIVKKYSEFDTINLRFDIKIIEMNHMGYTILGRHVEIGDTIWLPLSGVKISNK
jgi:hypothetical protein